MSADQELTPEDQLELIPFDELNLKRRGAMCELQLNETGALLGERGAPIVTFERLLASTTRDSWGHALKSRSIPRYTDLSLMCTSGLERWWVEWARLDGGWVGYAQRAHETLWRRRLMSRELGLSGLHHDLNNRLFMLRALPELSQFSSADELMEDLLEELPMTLSFFTERLSAEWLQSKAIKALVDGDEVKALSQVLYRLQRSGDRVEGYVEGAPLAPSEASSPLSPAFTGLLWSLTALCVQLRPTQQLEWSAELDPLSPAPNASPLTLSLHRPAALTPQWTAGGRLAFKGATRALTLSGGGVPWSIWLSRCPQPQLGAPSRALSYTSGEPPSEGWSTFVRRWLESWLNAADCLGGVVMDARQVGCKEGGLSLCFP